MSKCQHITRIEDFTLTLRYQVAINDNLDETLRYCVREGWTGNYYIMLLCCRFGLSATHLILVLHLNRGRGET